jgi:arsenate reductase
VEVWFNPACSRCRTARDELDRAGVAYTLRRYLDDPPTEDELRAALAALGLQPWDVTRTSEPLARELGLGEAPRATSGDADAWIRVLAEHPRLLQRPIVLADDGRAWVARDGGTLTEVVAAGRGTGEMDPRDPDTLYAAGPVAAEPPDDDRPERSPLRDSGGTGPGPDDLDRLL